MNIIQVQDDLKNFSEQQLIDEMQSPSGMAPQFLVLSELTRRRRVKEDFNARQAEQQPTVAQEAIAAAGMPQEGLPAMAEALAPKSASELSEGIGTSMPMSMRQPMQMQSGGLLSGYDEDMDFSNMSMEEMLEFMQRMKGLSEPMKMRAGGKFVADGRILDAIEFIESGGNPEAINKRTGAAGAYQILDSTALNPGYGVTPISLEDRFDKKKSRKFAKEYLEGIAKANPNFTTDQLIQSYHSGAGNVAKGNIGPEGKNYLTKFYGAMNQKPGGLETLLAKTGLVSPVEAANKNSAVSEGPGITINPNEMKAKETVSDLEIEQYIRDTKPDAIAAANQYTPPLPKSLESMMARSGTRSLVDDPEGFDRALDLSKDLNLEDLEKITKKKETYGTTMAANIATENLAKKLEDEKKVDKKEEGKKKEEDKKKDKTGAGKVYGLPFPDTGGTSDLESDILKLQKQLEKDRDVDKWLSIAKAGLAIADPTKTLSEAAETGIDAMSEARKRYSDGVIDLINARAKLAKAGKKGLKLSELFTNLDRIEKGILTFSEMGATPDPDKVRELNARKEQILQLIAKFPGYDVFKPVVDPKKQKVS